MERAAEEVTPRQAVQIALKELEQALSDPNHFAWHVESAKIWLRGVD